MLFRSYVRLGSGSCPPPQKTFNDICSRKTQNDGAGRTFWKRRQTVQRSRRFIFFCLQRDGQTAHQTCSLAHFPYRKGTGRSGSEVGSSDFREVGRPVWKLNFFFRAERRKRPNPASFQSRLRGECCICQRFGSIPKGT